MTEINVCIQKCDSKLIYVSLIHNFVITYITASAPNTTAISDSFLLCATNSPLVGMSIPYTLLYLTGGAADAKYTHAAPASRAI